jgi:hypothetical protein
MLGPIDDLRKVDLGRMDEGFSRQHFVAMAKNIKSGIERAGAGDAGSTIEAFEELASDIANTFAESNPRFDRQRFLDACGVQYGKSKEEGLPTKREQPKKHPRYNVDIPNRGHYSDDEE